MTDLKCSWCGEPIQPEDGYRLAEPAGERFAAFCRLEHVVPWALRGPHWEPGELDHEPDPELGDTCAHCGDRLHDTRVLLVHHRGQYRIADAFCSAQHAADWAKAGGRWR